MSELNVKMPDVRWDISFDFGQVFLQNIALF